MSNVELFKKMFTEEEFDSLLNSNKGLEKDESTEYWKNSKKIFLSDSGHKVNELKNTFKDGNNYWFVRSNNDCMAWEYKFIGNTYNELKDWSWD